MKLERRGVNQNALIFECCFQTKFLPHVPVSPYNCLLVPRTVRPCFQKFNTGLLSHRKSTNLVLPWRFIFPEIKFLSDGVARIVYHFYSSMAETRLRLGVQVTPRRTIALQLLCPSLRYPWVENQPSGGWALCVCLDSALPGFRRLKHMGWKVQEA